MANIRQKEFERSCIDLLTEIINSAKREATKQGKTPYDIVFSKEAFRTWFMTFYSCSNVAFERYFQNLENRGLIELKNTNHGYGLNPQRATGEEVFILTGVRVRFP